MKAIVNHIYGSPDVLNLEEIDTPTPKEGEVLIRLHAASINAWDWGLLRGTPFVNRLLFGLKKPRNKILGCDIAGRIGAVGSKVTRFTLGDEVFGDISEGNWGGFAEYVCARETALTLKPTGMTFEQAAAVPQAGVMALQGIRDKGQVQSGQKVLINGAGGGAGSFAVQIAKSFGAEVTGVDSTEKLDTMRSIGADHVIDFTREDFTKNGQQYDFIFDLEAHRSIFDNKRALSAKGIYAMAGGSMPRIFQVMLLGPWISMTNGKKMSALGLKQNKNMAFLNELFEAGKVHPEIDRRFPLSEVPEALRYFGEGHAKGKIVITM